MTPKSSSALESFKKAFIKPLIIGVTLTAALMAFAASRKVTIPVTKTGLQVLNGSSVAVNYNISCFGTNGSAVFSSNLSLPTHGAKSFGSDKACAGSFYSGSSGWDSGMGLCGSAVTRASADSQCAAGNHVCSLTEVISGLGGAYPTQGWVATNEFNSTWARGYTSDTSMWSGTDINLQFSSNEYPIAAGTGNYCTTGPSTNGTLYNSCSRSYGSSFPTYCCPDTAVGNITHCTVEIDASSPAGGYLQSPQFKGSSPF